MQEIIIFMDQELSINSYDHITQFFKVHSFATPAQVGECLGVYTFIDSDCILILTRKYMKTNFGYVLSICYQIDLKALILSFNNVPTIPQQLTCTAFPQLEVLDLSCNQIQSIVSLCRIYLPELKLLSLQGNRISNVKDIVKCGMFKLKTISLKANPYPQYFQLTELPWHTIETIEINEIPRKRKIMKLLTINIDLVFG